MVARVNQVANRVLEVTDRIMVSPLEYLIVSIAHPDILQAHECQDNPEQGCWFMTPAQHALDLLTIPLLFWCIGYELWDRACHGQSGSSSMHRRTILPYPFFVKFMVVFPYIAYAFCKLADPWRLLHQFGWCNVIHLLACIAVLTKNPWLRFHMTRFVSLHMFLFLIPIAAMPFGGMDFSGLSEFEIRLSMLIHVGLPCFIMYAAAKNRLNFADESFMKILAVGFLTFPVYLIVQLVLSLVTGMNINYLLAPPPGIYEYLMSDPVLYRFRSLGHWLGGVAYLFSFTCAYYLCCYVTRIWILPSRKRGSSILSLDSIFGAYNPIKGRPRTSQNELPPKPITPKRSASPKHPKPRRSRSIERLTSNTRKAFPQVETPLAYYHREGSPEKKWTIGLNAKDVLVAKYCDNEEYPIVYSNNAYTFTNGFDECAVEWMLSASNMKDRGGSFAKKLIWIATDSDCDFDRVSWVKADETDMNERSERSGGRNRSPVFVNYENKGRRSRSPSMTRIQVERQSGIHM